MQQHTVICHMGFSLLIVTLYTVFQKKILTVQRQSRFFETQCISGKILPIYNKV